MITICACCKTRQFIANINYMLCAECMEYEEIELLGNNGEPIPDVERIFMLANLLELEESNY